MIAMVQKLFFYIVGILIIGLLFSGITSFILSYLPYLFAGLVLTLPIYGAVRKKIQKEKTLRL
ncbi:hypothetical protein PP175_27700 (plasmid) [Aneurinibacillus sp. Ricciae_BoGa-3]|uniref:hypothetical protein n=1 Tax=Aneurinibacillus sp. Ricciae_BoGa-3 TaxID=3022697 RepID=UPI0023428093|nr:hypothetical protein [Aneurinibacillus sp. Ricciae_BoGa-3]WCK56978.1 hypothetical protein PP175_27700 [Aneurinibacillus sp. Ricciae_BoGa-3]